MARTATGEDGMKAFAAILAAGLALLVAGCGSEQDKMERGVVVDREVAVPDSNRELEMTTKQRKAANEATEEARESEVFEDTQE